MANQKLFSARAQAKNADTVNRAGGIAYALSDKAALAQLAMTGCLNETFYASAKNQLADAKALAGRVDVEFLAKLAVYARERGRMKDLPAFLLAVLATRAPHLLAQVFDRVVDNGKQLRNFVQIIRSGEAGRRSLGTRPKKLVAQWLNAANDAKLLAASIGSAPSLGEVVRLSHPKAGDGTREAFYAWLLDKKVEFSALPEVVRALESFRKGDALELPRAPFELLTSMPLSEKDWKTLAKNASWTQTRMNLNTFLRHGVFQSREMVSLVAARLSDPELIAKAGCFPYQLLAAYQNADDNLPMAVTNALQDAMELAVANVPAFDREVAVLVDTSGSMKDPVTGSRGSATTKVRCVDVAALFAAAVLRRNETATVVPFDTKVHTSVRLNPRDSIMTNTKALARNGGGTDCGCGLAYLNAERSKASLVIYVSDNESWVSRNTSNRYGYDRKTDVMAEWDQYKRRVPNAKLVCIDITPNKTTQAYSARNILNVGGFSDDVFNVIDLFARGELSGEHWIGEINKVVL